MKYKNATSMQRFFAFLIDSLLMYVISSLILICIPIYNTYSELFLDRYNYLMSGFNTADIDATFLEELMVSSMVIIGLNMAILIPLYILYYVVLPYFWKSQTLGRLALGLRVVTLEEEKPKLRHLLLRELVGGYLIYELLGGGIFYIVTLVLSISQGRSLIDYIGQTRLVNIRYPQKVEEPIAPDERDYVDAHFREVNIEESKPVNENPNDDSETDEYKVI